MRTDIAATRTPPIKKGVNIGDSI
ncbi:uncharacterized protein METZ01_LOCUS106779 [marine metagenome]|uniref:Uncharacterized protein n=1 Tax=marine metagenome TaxID=408172 RepID=A0A381WN80_9ZZZZ